MFINHPCARLHRTYSCNILVILFLCLSILVNIVTYGLREHKKNKKKEMCIIILDLYIHCYVTAD